MILFGRMTKKEFDYFMNSESNYFIGSKYVKVNAYKTNKLVYFLLYKNGRG